jgi:hypothetical protein
MKSVIVYSQTTKPSLLESVGIPDPNFLHVYEVGTEKGQVHPDKVIKLEDIGPISYSLGAEMIKDGLICPTMAARLCSANHVYMNT